MAREHENCPTCSCGRRALVQGSRKVKGPGTIAWSEHVEAWNAYAMQYGASQSAERINERGGFSFQELEALLGREPSTWRPAES